MRVTDGSTLARLLSGLGDSREIVDRSIAQLADGKRVRYVSDDVSGGSIALALHDRSVQIDGLTRSAEAARFQLEAIDGLIGETFGLLSDARADALGGTTITDAAQRDVLAREIEAIRAQVLAAANTQRDGRYLFSGTQSGSLPFDPAGVYGGDASETRANIDFDQQVGVTLAGDQVFQSAAGDLFAQLDALAAALRANDAAGVQAGVVELGAQLDKLSEVRAEVGLRLGRIDRALERQSDELLRVESQILRIENVSPEEATFELAQAQSRRESLATAAARVLGRSLLDFLG